MSETDFIAALRALPLHPGARGLEDDCAVIPLGGETLIVTHDMMAEGVHWLPGQDPADIAWKLVAVNLSDLAAKGAEPIGVLLGYSLQEPAANDAFQIGLSAALSAFSVRLLGGDTVCWKRAVHGLTALGRATHVPVPSRAGAQPGDMLWVTGTIGAALAGFEALKAGDTGPASAPYRRPVPLLAEGRALAPLVTAMMDVSDGLLLDAWRIAQASSVRLMIDGGSVPIALPAIRRDEALRWGDDYQLLFTLPAGSAPPVPATCIGQVERGAPVLVLDGALLGDPETLGYLHG